MDKMKTSPCLTCTSAADPSNCENKQCSRWNRWFLGRWRLIHGFYRKYGKEESV